MLDKWYWTLTEGKILPLWPRCGLLDAGKDSDHEVWEHLRASKLERRMERKGRKETEGTEQGGKVEGIK